MRNEVYKVGDAVRIRDWKDMAKEYPLGDDGSVDCPSTFTLAMRSLSGLEFTVTEVDDWNRTHDEYGYHGHEHLHAGMYYISGAMLERVESAKPLRKLRGLDEIL